MTRGERKRQRTGRTGRRKRRRRRRQNLARVFGPFPLGYGVADDKPPPKDDEDTHDGGA